MFLSKEDERIRIRHEGESETGELDSDSIVRKSTY